MYLQKLIEEVKRKLHFAADPGSTGSDDPDAPFAMVGARLKPRLPQGHSSAAVQPER